MINTSKPRLLVVDDNPEICEFLRLVSTEMGFDVVDETRAAAALRIIDSFKPNIILLDLRMPDMDGIEMIATLGEKRCDAKIVLISGMDQRTLSSVQSLGLEHKLDMHSTLSKPMSVETIEATLGPLMQALTQATGSEGEETAPSTRQAEVGFHVRYEPELAPTGAATEDSIGLRALPYVKQDSGRLLGEKELYASAQSTGFGEAFFKAIVSEIANDRLAWEGRGFTPKTIIGLPAFLTEIVELPQILERLLQRYHQSLSGLTLELFESDSMSLSPRAQEVLSRLRLKGAEIRSFVADDGESSLSSSDALPIDHFIVDLAMLSNGGSGKQDIELEFLYSSLNSVAGRKGLQVTAINANTKQAVGFALQCRFHSLRGTEVQGELSADEALDFPLPGQPTLQSRAAE